MSDAPPALSSSYAKVARARKQLEGLALEFQQFSDSRPYTLRHEHDLETQEFLLVYHPSAPIPDHWAIILGEIFHNLRSALDLAVHELTIRETGAPLKNTEFPIFEDKEQFFASKRNGDPAPGSGLFKIRGLSQESKDCIETLQPYNLHLIDSVSILSLLQEMNIIDKHRELHLCRMMAEKTWVNAIRDIPGVVRWALCNVGGNLDDRAVIARLKLTGALDDTVYLDADVDLDIVFDQRSSSSFKKQESVVKVTTNIIDGVDIVLHHLEDSLN